MRVAFLFVAMLVCLEHTGFAHEPANFTWDFEKTELNSAPDFLEYIPSLKERFEEWVVLKDGTDKVLRQQDFPTAKERATLAIVRDLEIDDAQLTVRMKAVGGKDEQCGGLVWRYRDSKNYLLARLDIEDRQLSLVRVVDGNRVTFGEKKELKVEAGKWYTLRVDHRENKIQVYLDNNIALMESDKHFRKAGKVGLYTYSDSIMNFDDLTLRELERD